ncbi:TPA: hypothetical protein QFT23_000978 [Bacillus cereus]|nr:hypothetical protein [Bacillus cereus]
MLHTANFYVKLTSDEVQKLENKFHTTITLILNQAESKFNGVKINIQKKEQTNMWFIYTFIDFIELLQKSDGVITEKDYSEVNKKLKALENFLFDSTEKFILLRIDYRLDIIVEEPNTRKLLISLYDKLSEKHRFQKKCNIDSKTQDKYKTTLYFNSKSINTVVYDKEQERNDKKKPIKTYEHNVLRFEVRLHNKHLLNMRSKKHRAKTLEQYFKYSLWKEYMLKYVQEVFFSGDFYTIYHAKKIINESNLKTREKTQLIKLLKDISFLGMENIKSWTEKNQSKTRESLYSRPTIRKYIKLLSELNINPILIPKNKKGAPSKIKNPLQALQAI